MQLDFTGLADKSTIEGLKLTPKRENDRKRMITSETPKTAKRAQNKSHTPYTVTDTLNAVNKSIARQQLNDLLQRIANNEPAENIVIPALIALRYETDNDQLAHIIG